ncbi:hypothetical protein SNE40_016301 [Patella caerulea]|uniref:Uncharacterized protein n=1 Tax=Patella caerulea TaxID=87958 RepID=A0AAN8J9N8_PATCE
MLNKLNILRNSSKIDELQSIYLGTDALGLLGHCNRATNLHRREMHKPDLSTHYVHVASSYIPFTTYLYGDDVSKNVSDIDSVNKVGNNIRRSGGFGWAPGNRGRFRGGFRGRGGYRGGPIRGNRQPRGGLGKGFSYHSNYDQSDNETTDPKNFKAWHRRTKKN